jgi:tryptophan synthase alpha chain
MSFARLFAETKQESRAALLPYLMAGVPDAATSADLFVAMSEAGADGFEIGLPYADPLMDGPVIQTAGSLALAAGATLESGFAVAGEVVERTGKPCAVMTYTNPVLRVGPGEFAARAADAGVAAVIIADLPVDEAGPFREAAAAHEVGLVLFAAPTTTDERLRRVVAAAPPFVYGIAEMGVTGERSESGGLAARLTARIRALTDLPVVLGVGISGPEAAATAAHLADGVIVGSALVRRVLEAPDGGAAAADLRAAVSELAAAMLRTG